MTVQQDPQVDIEGDAAAAQTAIQSPARPRPRPNLSGDLKAMLESGPAFSPALRGYDRLQVDNYVAWAEHELLASRRAVTELVRQLGERDAEVQRAQRTLAHSPQSRELLEVSDRVAEILRLAAAEADAARTAGAAEAAEIVAQAHVEADLIKRRAQQLEAQAAARLEEADRLSIQATAAVDRSRVEAEQILQQAAAERQRLDARAERARADAAAAAARQLAAEEEQAHRTREAAEAEAAARVADAQQQLESLLKRQERVRKYLASLAEQVDAALGVLADEPTREFSFIDNTAVVPADDTPTLVMWSDSTRLLADNDSGQRETMCAAHPAEHRASAVSASVRGRGSEHPMLAHTVQRGSAEVQRV